MPAIHHTRWTQQFTRSRLPRGSRTWPTVWKRPDHKHGEHGQTRIRSHASLGRPQRRRTCQYHAPASSSPKVIQINDFICRITNEATNKCSYAEAAAKASFLLRDQLETPLERAVFWTEHVLRHKGTRHLQLGSKDLAPYQRALVDVYAILFIAGFLMFVCLFHCMQMCAIKLCKLVCPSCSASF